MILTTSLAFGTRAGVQVDGDDHEPFAALRIVGFAAKFGMWSCAVWMICANPEAGHHVRAAAMKTDRRHNRRVVAWRWLEDVRVRGRDASGRGSGWVWEVMIVLLA